MHRITLEQLHFDEWRTQSDIDEKEKENIEVYEMTDEEYNLFLEAIGVEK